MDRQKQDNFNLSIQYIKEGYLQTFLRKQNGNISNFSYMPNTGVVKVTILKKLIFLILCNFYSIVILTIVLVITKGWYCLFTIVIYTLINGLILNKIGIFLISAQARIEIDFLEKFLRIQGIVFSTTNSYRKTSSKIPLPDLDSN